MLLPQHNEGDLEAGVKDRLDQVENVLEDID